MCLHHSRWFLLGKERLDVSEAKDSPVRVEFCSVLHSVSSDTRRCLGTESKALGRMLFVSFETLCRHGKGAEVAKHGDIRNFCPVCQLRLSPSSRATHNPAPYTAVAYATARQGDG